MVDLFFFSAHFLSQEKFKVHSLTRLQSLFFFSRPGKKNDFFYSLTRFLPKIPKTQTITGKKKRYLWSWKKKKWSEQIWVFQIS